MLLSPKNIVFQRKRNVNTHHYIESICEHTNFKDKWQTRSTDDNPVLLNLKSLQLRFERPSSVANRLAIAPLNFPLILSFNLRQWERRRLF